MIKYLIIVLILIGCSGPRFTFNQKVMVNNGFYKHCTGIVTNYDIKNNSYLVKFTLCNQQPVKHNGSWFYDFQLEPLNE